MTALALANASAHAARNVVARTSSSIRHAFSRLGAVLARLQEARLAAEMHRIRHRINCVDDDDHPVIK